MFAIEVTAGLFNHIQSFIRFDEQDDDNDDEDDG